MMDIEDFLAGLGCETLDLTGWTGRIDRDCASIAEYCGQRQSGTQVVELLQRLHRGYALRRALGFTGSPSAHLQEAQEHGEFLDITPGIFTLYTREILPWISEDPA